MMPISLKNTWGLGLALVGEGLKLGLALVELGLVLGLALGVALGVGQVLALGLGLVLVQGLMLVLALALVLGLVLVLGLGLVLGMALVGVLGRGMGQAQGREDNTQPQTAKFSQKQALLDFTDASATKLTEFFPADISQDECKGIVCVICETCQEAYKAGGIWRFRLTLTIEMACLLGLVVYYRLESLLP